VPWRQWLSNGFFVASLYAALGAGVEGVRRLWSPSWADQLSFALDGLPARVLGSLGLLERMKDAYREGQLSHLGLRAIFGGTTVLLILGIAFATGLLVWLLALPLRRRARHPGSTG
jgi:hypothetical protein